MADPNELHLIYAYSRTQAIVDGVLVDVSATAQEAGFVIPVAVTRMVWDEVITPNDTARSLGQSEAGRLWDILWMLRYAIRRPNHSNPSRLLFELLVSHGDRPVGTVTLKAICGPGDEAEPV